MAITLTVPTINDNPDDFDRLFQLWSQVNGDGLDVTFDFSRCRFLRQNGVAFLGGLARLIVYRGGRYRFAWDTLDSKISANLSQNGFMGAFADDAGPWLGNSIPFREDAKADKNSLMDYLKSHWLGRGWVSVSHALRDVIVGRVYEIYANAFEHAESAIGLFSCGQHFPKRRELNLTVVDFGVGIPSNVRIFVQRPNLQAHKALEWAFRPGTTTKPNGMGRGMGLDMLRQFVSLNKGKLEVYSHDGHAIIDGAGVRVQTRANFFEGTLVNLSLVCDDSYYCLASEAARGPLF